MLKGVIFDLDGVVVDSHPLHVRAWQQFFASLGICLCADDVEYILDGHRREEILRHFLGDCTADTLCAYGAIKDKLFRAEAAAMRPIAGVTDLLEHLQGAGIGAALATSARRDRAEFVLDRLGMRAHFATVVTADDVAEDKPHPRIYQVAGERLGCEAADLLVAEDAVSGVIGAKTAGMCCLGVTQNGRADKLREAGADAVVPDFQRVSIPSLEQLLAARSRALSIL